MTIDTTLTFTTRDTYLAWRAEWRAEYRKLSLAIRTSKRNIAQRFKNGGDAATLQHILLTQQYHAIIMLGLRAESKTRAAAQYNAQHLALAA
jgi:hypothetical protein